MDYISNNICSRVGKKGINLLQRTLAKQLNIRRYTQHIIKTQKLRTFKKIGTSRKSGSLRKIKKVMYKHFF